MKQFIPFDIPDDSKWRSMLGGSNGLLFRFVDALPSVISTPSTESDTAFLFLEAMCELGP